MHDDLAGLKAAVRRSGRAHGERAASVIKGNGRAEGHGAVRACTQTITGNQKGRVARAIRRGGPRAARACDVIGQAPRAVARVLAQRAHDAGAIDGRLCARRDCGKRRAEGRATAVAADAH